MREPLANLIRPATLDEVAGQAHLVGERGIIRRMLEQDRITNMIFCGPPGTGKTTIANIIAKNSNMELHKLNATTASLSDIKEIMSSTNTVFGSKGILLYLDEIQYFNRKQQQSLLSYMEDGRITLIASTTENPYMYIYNAILSRSSVFEFKPVPPADCVKVLRKAISAMNDKYSLNVTATDDTLFYIATKCGGDVRSAINICEQAYFVGEGELSIDDIDRLSPAMGGIFDKSGDGHYDMLSCLHKSIRGSDPDAAIFYLARILAGGDIISPCRRLQCIANEDIGQAWPMAAILTRCCVESARELGLPEAALPLSNCVIALATAPKSNAAYTAYANASADVAAGKGAEVPKHLAAPMYQGYKYPHDYPGHFVEQQYLPNDLKNKKYFTFGESKTEQAAKAYYDYIRSTFGK